MIISGNEICVLAVSDLTLFSGFPKEDNSWSEAVSGVRICSQISRNLGLLNLVAMLFFFLKLAVTHGETVFCIMTRSSHLAKEVGCGEIICRSLVIIDDGRGRTKVAFKPLVYDV